MPTMEYYHMLLRELGPTVKDFEREVYTRGLARAIGAEPTRGMGGELAGVTILTFVMAGRVLVTLTRAGEQVSVMAAEGEDPPRMGLHTRTEEEYQALATQVDRLRAALAFVVLDHYSSPTGYGLSHGTKCAITDALGEEGVAAVSRDDRLMQRWIAVRDTIDDPLLLAAKAELG
jgi:hypothetical protein